MLAPSPIPIPGAHVRCHAGVVECMAHGWTWGGGGEPCPWGGWMRWGWAGGKKGNEGVHGKGWMTKEGPIYPLDDRPLGL